MVQCWNQESDRLTARWHVAPSPKAKRNPVGVGSSAADQLEEGSTRHVHHASHTRTRGEAEESRRCAAPCARRGNGSSRPPAARGRVCDCRGRAGRQAEQCARGRAPAEAPHDLQGRRQRVRGTPLLRQPHALSRNFHSCCAVALPSDGFANVLSPRSLSAALGLCVLVSD
jgi:hypothetical protein